MVSALEKLMNEEGIEIIKNAEVTEIITNKNFIKGVKINNKKLLIVILLFAILIHLMFIKI